MTLRAPSRTFFSRGKRDRDRSKEEYGGPVVFSGPSGPALFSRTAERVEGGERGPLTASVTLWSRRNSGCDLIFSRCPREKEIGRGEGGGGRGRVSYSRHGPVDGAKARETPGPRPLKDYTERAKSSGGSYRCQPKSQRNGQGRNERDKASDGDGDRVNECVYVRERKRERERERERERGRGRVVSARLN